MSPVSAPFTITVVPIIPNLNVAQYVADPSTADHSPDGFDITDTAARVSTIFDALDADTHRDAITLNNSGTPTLTLNAIQALDDTTALAKISNSSYAIAIVDTTGGVAANLDALNGDLAVTAIRLTDPSDPLAVSVGQITSDVGALGELTNGYSLAVTGGAAAVSGALDALQANPHVTSITLTDPSDPLAVSVAQIASDAVALGELTNGYSLAVTDSAADVENGLATLEADASHIASITANGTVGVSAATFVADRAALDKIVGGFDIVDTAADIKTYLNFLSDRSIVAVTISDNVAVGANVAQLTSNATTIAKLHHANGSAYQLAISDTAANIQNGIATLVADTSHIASITASGGPASFSTTLFAADEPTLNKIVGGFAIADTAAKVSGSLDALQADVADIASIAFTDSSTPTVNVTAAQFTADANALTKITSPYVLDDTNSNGTSSIVSYGNGLTFDIGAGTSSSIKGSGVNETFDFSAGFKTATITGFASVGGVAANDQISLAKSDFADWNMLLSDAHAGAAGSTTFTSTTSGASLTLAGVSLSAFEKAGAPYQSEFSFHA